VRVGVAIGDGRGNFAMLDPIEWSDCCTFSGGVGDLDGDGHLDAVVRDSISIRVLLGDGTGRLALDPQAYTPTGAVAFGDINGKSGGDIATVFDKAYSFLDYRRGSGFQAQGGPFGVPADGVISADLADLNGDGHRDFVAVHYSSIVSVYIGDGKGNFDVERTFVVSSSPGPLVIADFNGDRAADIVVGHRFSKYFTVTLGTGVPGCL
jgi:hypothetical protein